MISIVRIYIIAGILLGHFASAQQVNGVKATVSPVPNYSLTKDKSNVSSLTDGIFTSGNMYWKDPGTLGWQNVNRVTIDLTLPSNTNVGYIKLNTVTGQKAQVNLPLNVMVFASNDQQTWQLIGDMEKPEDEYYKIFSLTQQINRNARYLRLVVVPNGSYFFTDEIQVFASKNRGRDLQPAVASAAIDSLVKNKRTAAIDQRFATQKTFAAKEMANTVSLSPLIAAWSASDQYAQKTETINTLIGLTSYTSFAITNNTAKQQQLPVSLTGGNIAEVYWARPVKSRDFKIVPDALMPVANGATLSVKPGETQLLLLKIKPVSSGTTNLLLKVGDQQSAVSVVTAARKMSDYKQTPDVNVWAYFNDPLLKERPLAAQKDLLDHGVNTFVFHPGILLPDKPFNGNATLQKMIPMTKGFKQVLLFLNIPGKGNDYWHDERKNNFITWYKAMQTALQQQGIAASNIYLYPVDEVKPAQLEAYKSFVGWVKSAIPGVKIFATVSDIKSLKEVEAITDIVQVHNTNQLITAARSASGSAQVWLYDTKKPAKSLPPYSYYRLMGWKAFANGITGLGFWQYADAGHEAGETSLWDDFDGKSADYNVVYDDKATVISSRRWEAFKEGIDDYVLLSAYAQRYGKSAALKICNEVLDNAGNPFTGEQARRNIISALEK